VEENKLTAQAKRYLYTFIPDEDSDSIGEEEISKLDLLIQELKQERQEIKNDLAEFIGKHGEGGGSGEEDKRETEEMQDDIEYLTGENKELQSKVKEVCL
jgi:chromosome segregation ATPase